MNELDVLHGVAALLGGFVLLGIAVGGLHVGTEHPTVTALMLVGFGLMSLGIAAEFLLRGLGENAP